MNLDGFFELIKEDVNNFGSQNALAKSSKTYQQTIQRWYKQEIKTAPLRDVLEEYVKNLDCDSNRKKLYFEYCGYSVPIEYQEEITLIELTERGIENKAKLKLFNELKSNCKKINLPDGAVAFVFPDNNDNTTKTS